jgi:plasmid replication initiation protein
MGNLVVKDNAFIEASYTLDIVEQRLILLAILEARSLGDDIEKVLNQTISIHAQSYMKQFEVEKNTAYEALKRGVNGLFEAEFNYIQINERTGKAEYTRSRFVQKITYIDDLGTVKLVFANDVVPLIIGLEKKFTKYEIQQIKGLQSRYAIRLYELLIKWRSIGVTELISLEDLRTQLGLLEHEYKRMHHFKVRVLDLAISQVNQHTDIIVEYEQHKTGRTISGFTFKFQQRNNSKALGKSSNVKFMDMTDAQRISFSKKLAYVKDLEKYATGEAGKSYERFAEKIAKDLLDPEKQPLYHSHLAKLGFKYK